MAKKKKDNPNTIAKNRHAFHDYEILENFEAGIELVGCEVKSLQENNAQITDAFCMIREAECWLNNLHIPPYSHGNIANPDPDRKRKLLLHKREIRHLAKKNEEKGLAIIPLKLYYAKNGKVKVEIALARGKKLHDKRQTMKERDVNREIQRELKMRSR